MGRAERGHDGRHSPGHVRQWLCDYLDRPARDPAGDGRALPAGNALDSGESGLEADGEADGLAARRPCGLSLLLGLDVHDDHADVVLTTAFERGLDERGADLRGPVQRGGDDLFDLVVAYHFPEAVGAEQQNILRLQGQDEPVQVLAGMMAQAAVYLVAPGMGVDVLGRDQAVFYQASHGRVVARDLGEAAGGAIEVDAAIPGAHDVGSSIDDQGGGDSRVYLYRASSGLSQVTRDH